MNRHTSRTLRGLIVFFLLGMLLSPSFAFAATAFTAAPLVIDGKGKIREILHYSITLVNTTKHLVSIYPWVTDVDSVIGDPGTTDLAGSQSKELAQSLARWIEVTRGSVDILPGEQKEVSITVQVNMNAKPGNYHATIHLSSGGTRPDAEANKAETVDTLMNIEVLDDINERLQLNTFIPDKNVFAGESASFNYNIENIGNRGEIPRGKIRIYDKDGREVATIDANQDGTRLEPSSKVQLSSVWASSNGFGRYKAMLDLEYGGRGTLQDTVFFWVIPWKKLLGMFLSLIILCVIGAIIIHSYTQSRRQSVLAGAVAGQRRFWNIFPFGSDDEDEYDEEEWEEVEVHQKNSRVDELRQIPVPPPVHTRLYSTNRVDYSASSSVHLEGRPTADMSSHKVILGKKEPPATPKEHIINLKR